MSHHDPTALTDTAWTVLALLIPAANPGGRLCTTDMRQGALIMASATPASSEGSTSISARAARGVRGLHHDAESPQVADAVIEDTPGGPGAMNNDVILHTFLRSHATASACKSCTPEHRIHVDTL